MALVSTSLQSILDAWVFPKVPEQDSVSVSQRQSEKSCSMHTPSSHSSLAEEVNLLTFLLTEEGRQL